MLTLTILTLICAIWGGFAIGTSEKGTELPKGHTNYNKTIKKLDQIDKKTDFDVFGDINDLPDAYDFLPGVHYDGWTAKSALKSYLKSEIDVYDYEDILDCLIEEWKNPLPTNIVQEKILKNSEVPPVMIGVGLSQGEILDAGGPKRIYGSTVSRVGNQFGYPLQVQLDKDLEYHDPGPHQDMVYLFYKGQHIKLTRHYFREMEKGLQCCNLKALFPSEDPFKRFSHNREIKPFEGFATELQKR